MAKRNPKAAPAANEPGEFASILDQVMDDIVPPSPVPVGTWKVKGISAKFKEGDGSEDFSGQDSFMFVYTPVEPQDDVAEDEVESGEWKGAKMFFRLSNSNTRGLMDDVRKHLAKHGIDTSGGKTIKDGLALFNKAKPEVYAAVSIRTYTDNLGEVRQDNNLKAFAPVE